MNAVFKIFLSMSFSGGLLILSLLLGKRFLKNKISRQWQYYIWIAVVLRLLLPFGPEVSLLGKTYQAVGQAVTQTAFSPQQQPPVNTLEGTPAPAAILEPDIETANSPEEDGEAVRLFRDIGALLINHAGLIWLAAALGLLIRRITIYQGFIRYIRAGLTPVSDTEILDRLSIAAEQAGVKKPVELCVNPLIASPLLIGFFRPCIILPNADIPEKNFQYIVLHEMTHYKRRDMFYKWLVQTAVCLHWFNPLVHLMSREITKACEFSCDEAVLVKAGYGGAQDYGKTLLDAMVAVGQYRENPGAVTLSENKQLLKERLGAIMNFKQKTAVVKFLTGVLTFCMVFGAAFIGVYPAAAASQTAGNPPVRDQSGKDTPPVQETDTDSDRYSFMAERYYKTGSLPLFQMVFLKLDEEEQCEWLDRIYTDRQLLFFGAAVTLLDDDCAQIQHLAETIYADGDIVYFSNLTAHMSGDTLEAWLDRALEDDKWTFQSVLFNALDRGDDFDEQKEKEEKEWEEAQAAEYGPVGVTIDGKNYYYKGQLVNIFLDIRQPNQSFYTLNMNPKGTVNIKIVRNKNNEITGVAYMTEAEVTELFGDCEDDLSAQ